jgi:hypothetical protein
VTDLRVQDMEDPTIGFLLDGMDRLIGLIRKYTPGIEESLEAP